MWDPTLNQKGPASSRQGIRIRAWGLRVWEEVTNSEAAGFGFRVLFDHSAKLPNP